MRTVNYKGFQASVEFDDGKLFVKVLHIDDLLVAQCDMASEAQAAAEELIDAYIADCEELGRPLTKPFNGSFNVRLTPETHRRAAMAAADEGLRLNAWMSEAVEEKLECGKLSDRIDGVFSSRTFDYNSEGFMEWFHLKTTETKFEATRVREFKSGGENENGVVSLDIFREAMKGRKASNG
ncbi:type II toxin-antitoxin system HicB family antitoxin [Rhizobium sp. LjRoot98]|uniref:type II toxin-antitoxin system HicB family antitoxin n=1 Tax=Rhizobium sp. LjRoot98 TaxID=3342345 RepID=UPI003ECE2451